MISLWGVPVNSNRLSCFCHFVYGRLEVRSLMVGFLYMTIRLLNVFFFSQENLITVCSNIDPPKQALWTPLEWSTVISLVGFR